MNFILFSVCLLYFFYQEEIYHENYPYRNNVVAFGKSPGRTGESIIAMTRRSLTNHSKGSGSPKYGWGWRFKFRGKTGKMSFVRVKGRAWVRLYERTGNIWRSSQREVDKHFCMYARECLPVGCVCVHRSHQPSSDGWRGWKWLKEMKRQRGQRWRRSDKKKMNNRARKGIMNYFCASEKHIRANMSQTWFQTQRNPR